MKLKKGDRVRIGGVVYSGQKSRTFGRLGVVERVVCANVDVLIDGDSCPTCLAACCLFLAGGV